MVQDNNKIMNQASKSNLNYVTTPRLGEEERASKMQLSGVNSKSGIANE
jgi:hypothetical protein